MRSVVLIVALGACTFRSHATSSDAPVGTADSSHLGDAPGDTTQATVDAPPDACADDDGDGICNAADDWPCGVKPAAPSQTVMMMGNNGATKMTLSQISANGSQLVVVNRGDPIMLSFHYAIVDTACQSMCIDQIEVGYVPGNRVRCMFDQGVSKQNGAAGLASAQIDAPNQVGVYDLRSNIGQNTSCGNGTQWWSSQPDDTRTIARVCVH